VALDPEAVAVLPLLPLEELKRHALTAGWAIGTLLHAHGLPRTVGSVGQLIDRAKGKISGTTLVA